MGWFRCSGTIIMQRRCRWGAWSACWQPPSGGRPGLSGADQRHAAMPGVEGRSSGRLAAIFCLMKNDNKQLIKVSVDASLQEGCGFESEHAAGFWVLSGFSGFLLHMCSRKPVNCQQMCMWWWVVAWLYVALWCHPAFALESQNL